ncbi:hypothetical protein [Streptomyces sp. NRRL F-5727]|uniref:hypothetical protein n=1 Tax=Streptomyces sp. NRRL F-5727 TaxID=1463871 RepID=UPI0004CA6555|nr:hypothetical protein [Streptomyces sp. NRRL F-5727]
MRVHRIVVPVLAVMAVATGCSSSEDGADRQRSTESRQLYCTALGVWQDASRAEGAKTPDSAAYQKIGPAAENVYAATRPLRDEHVTGGRTLAEETSLAVRLGDVEAEGRVSDYCQAAGFETLLGSPPLGL